MRELLTVEAAQEIKKQATTIEVALAQIARAMNLQEIPCTCCGATTKAALRDTQVHLSVMATLEKLSGWRQEASARLAMAALDDPELDRR